MNTLSVCPCGLGDVYERCCQSYHLGELAENAEQLMRSRYSAFVYQEIDYIIATTLPIQQHLLDRVALLAWTQQLTWQKLTIKQVAKLDRLHSKVHFCADFIYNDTGVQECHEEHSVFVQMMNAQNKPCWYFLDPTVPILRNRQAVCPCKSGKKFQSCCGRFL